MSLGEGKESLDEGKESLGEGKESLDEGKESLDEGKESLGEGKESLDEGKMSLDEGKMSLDEGKMSLGEGKESLDEGEESLDEGEESLLSDLPPRGEGDGAKPSEGPGLEVDWDAVRNGEGNVLPPELDGVPGAHRVDAREDVDVGVVAAGERREGPRGSVRTACVANDGGGLAVRYGRASAHRAAGGHRVVVRQEEHRGRGVVDVAAVSGLRRHVDVPPHRHGRRRGTTRPQKRNEERAHRVTSVATTE